MYAIHGDEPLLVLEAADAVRAAARRQGFDEREVLRAGRSFDWSELAHAGASLSLFGGKKIVELRLTGGKPSAQAAEAMVAWCERPSPEALLLITMPRPEGGGWWDAPWFMALNKAGVVVEVAAVARGALPGWLQKRLARRSRARRPRCSSILADRVEGNLLAAHQEVQKLALLRPKASFRFETVRDAVADVARYDTNVAAEALLEGDTERYLRVLDGLRGEGEAPPLSAVHDFAVRCSRCRARRAEWAEQGAAAPRSGRRRARAISPEALDARDRARRARSTARSRASARATSLGRVRQARPRASMPRRALPSSLEWLAMQVKTYMPRAGPGPRAPRRASSRAPTPPRKTARSRAMAAEIRSRAQDDPGGERRGRRSRRRRPAATPPSSTA